MFFTNVAWTDGEGDPQPRNYHPAREYEPHFDSDTHIERSLYSRSELVPIARDAFTTLRVFQCLVDTYVLYHNNSPCRRCSSASHFPSRVRFWAGYRILSHGVIKITHTPRTNFGKPDSPPQRGEECRQRTNHDASKYYTKNVNLDEGLLS